MKNDIAIIGMAGRFPGASNLREFYRNLKAGRDSVTEISAARFCESNFPLLNERYQVMGLLDQIDKFDRKFFSVAPREAQQMDPHQRVMMEIAYEALEDSGYSPASFNGTETAIICPNGDYSYLRRLTDLEATMYSGNTPFSIAGRLARFFNTTGPTFIVDTGCSSGLMGISLGCDQINQGHATQALIVGARVVLDPLPVVLDVDMAVTSTDGKTRSFNADSNGSGSSEALAAVLLKPMAQALQDGDHIYAVIKGAASNTSAQSSVSLTATSSAAQAALLTKAWQRAGVAPDTIGYIEAHGSGTKLGDPIEILGIDTAFRPFTDRKHICAVSCVKSNIGHTDKMAGLSGLVKAALSLEKRELFPSIHFDKPNPLIDFANSVTYINTEFKPWERHNGTPRRAGVSSFGFAGNNVHVVLEEAPPRASSRSGGESSPSEAGPFLVTVSSKRAGGVADTLAALRQHLEEEPGIAIADVSFTLNTGREHFRHRAAFLARDVPELIEQIRRAPGTSDRGAGSDAATEAIFVFSDDVPVDEATTAELAARFSGFAQSLENCRRASAELEQTTGLRRFAFQYALYRLLGELGLAAQNIVGVGAGDLVVQTVSEEIALEDALRECQQAAATDESSLETRLAALVDRQSGTGRVMFVEMGADGGVSRALRRLQATRRDEVFDVIALDPAAADGASDLVRRVYLSGGTVDWAAFHRQLGGRRISLPGYQFEKIRCWHCPPHTPEAFAAWRRQTQGGEAGGLQPITIAPPEPALRSLTVDASWSPTEQEVGRIWLEVLKIDEVGLDDDFFSLGGHSLFGTMVRNRIEKSFRLRLEFKDIFVHSKIRTLARSIDHVLARGGQNAAKATISTVPAAAHYAVSPSQFRLWLLDQKEGAMQLAYNVSVVLRIRGPLDAARLEQALHRLVERHEGLRTHFIEVAGEPRQVVNATVDFKVERRTATEATVATLAQEFIRPFDLRQPPLIRSAIFRVESDSHVLALDIHHTLFDGTSFGLVLRELAALYQGQALPPLPVTYKDFAAWRMASLQEPAMKESEAFWLEVFSQPPAPLELPTDYPRPAARNFDGGIREAKIDAGQTARVRALAQAEGATLFMVLLAAYSTLLAKYSGQDDIVVGSSVAGRTHADLEPVVGLFVNTVAFRTAPREERSFREYLGQVKEACLQTYKHQDYPFESILQKLNVTTDRARNPLFDTMLVLQNLDFGNLALAEGIALSPGEFVRKSAKFDLTLEVYETADGLALNLEYCAALFKPATVDRLAADLGRLLALVAENPDQRLSEIAIGAAARTVPAERSDFSFADL